MSSWAVLNVEPSQNDGWKSKMDEKLLCFAAASAHDSKKSVEEHKSMHSKTTVALLAVAKTAADFDASAKQFHP